MKWGSVESMVRYLDRKEIAEARRRHAKKCLRRIKNKNFRRFVSTLKYEVERDKDCHEWNIREKVCSRLKIGRATYFRLLKI